MLVYPHQLYLRRNMFLDLVNEYRHIQSNITEKFIRCFYRMNYHFPNVSITSLPMELDDSLYISLSSFLNSNNEIFQVISPYSMLFLLLQKNPEYF